MSLLRFDKFMEHALHHPKEGYYARRIQSIGSEGDFSTSASLSDALARSIAQWVVGEAEAHQLRSVHLIEMGAGTGQLCKEVRNALPFLFRRRVMQHIVETSAPLIALQKKLVGSKVQWHQSPQAALKKCNGIALLYSNELADAFPVRVFRKEQEGFTELFIDSKERTEHFVSADRVGESSFFQQRMLKGTRFEVHQSYHQWLAQWAPHFTKGSLLTVDYGDSVEALLQSNPKGSLRGYFRHNLILGSDLYRNIGHQDITADVNFTDLIKWGETMQLETTRYTTQRDFLDSSGSAQDQFLTSEPGAGTAFKVLSQRRATSASC